MSTWGKRRRNAILLGVFLLLTIPGSLFLFLKYYEEPTCFDNKKNGGERGIDCGGNCDLLCPGQALSPLVHWERFFEVGSGIYNVIAYLENQNLDSGTKSLLYKFTLFDKENAILAERIGSVRIHPREITPVIENTLNAGKIKPTRVQFEIIEEPFWEKETPRENIIVIEDEKISEVDFSTRIKARLTNISFGEVHNIDVIGILYDKDDNALNVSSTFVESLDSNTSKDILFTWPKTFDGKITRFEIIPLYEFN